MKKGSAGTCRYGFNGKESDNEVNGPYNELDYGMRVYEPRLGRFLSVDPLTKKFAMLTPYQFSSNSPVANIDLDGLEKVYFTLIWNDKSKTPTLRVDKVETHASWLGGLFKTKLPTLTYQVTYESSSGNSNFTFHPYGGNFDVSIGNTIDNFQTWLSNPHAYKNPISGTVQDFGQLFVSNEAEDLSHLGAGAASIGAMANSYSSLGKNYSVGSKNKQVVAAHGDNEEAIQPSQNQQQQTPIQQAQDLSGKGPYKDVGGHHIHAKAGFKSNINYDLDEGFSISQSYMNQKGWDHQAMTNRQRELFKELNSSGRPNTLADHTRIAVEALKAGGASQQEARNLVGESLNNLRKQGVTTPSNIPWYK